MSALGYEQLVQYLMDEDEERRLIVAPLLDPRRQVNERQAAIDVRLGRVFSLVRPWTQGVAESLGAEGGFASEPPLEKVVLDFGQPLIIHPHQFVLARTLEMVRLPTNLLGYVIGRSSWGRRGLIVATAVVLHPNFSGPITLELRNLGEVPIALYPLDRVAQLTFHELGTRPLAPADRSQFDSSFEPLLGRVRDEETALRLRKMISRRQPKPPQGALVASPEHDVEAKNAASAKDKANDDV
jgi:dCTP deaminase